MNGTASAPQDIDFDSHPRRLARAAGSGSPPGACAARGTLLRAAKDRDG